MASTVLLSCLLHAFIISCCIYTTNSNNSVLVRDVPVDHYIALADNPKSLCVGHCILYESILSPHTAFSNKRATRASTSNPNSNNATTFLTILILICGDIHPCPGPRKAPVYKFPCGKCDKPVKSNQKGICCDQCDVWFHIKCINMAANIYQCHVQNQDMSWLCNSCAVPFMFSDSFFSNNSFTESQHNSSATSEPEEPDLRQTYDDFIGLRKKHPGNFTIAHININSLQYKHDELKILLENNLVDCLFIAETKLNDSHVSTKFEIENYQLFRKDNPHDNGGGIVCYIRSDIPAREEIFDTYPCENLSIIAHIKGVKWALIGAYRKPSISQQNITDKLDPIIDKCMDITPNIFVTGDLNCNMLKGGANAVRTLCDDFNFVNVVTKPTCFKADPPTLLDVILVNDHKIVKKCDVFPCSLSDFHHFTCAVLDIKIPKMGKRQVTYRSYKNFNETHFNNDLTYAPFSAGECLDVDDQCYFVSELYRQVLDDHAPLKTKTVRSNQCPYMNSKWKTAIFKKSELYNKYWKFKSQKNWSLYRKQRNLCEKLKRESIRNYMNEKCTNSKTEPKDFWNMVKPFLSNKATSHSSVQLLEGDKFINDPQEVAEVFNQNFVSVANNIGQNSKYSTDIANHPSFDLIKEHMLSVDSPVFDFKPTSVSEVSKILKGLDPNKATGYDGIPPKAIKASSSTIAPTLCNIINKMFVEHAFPDPAKKAEVVPIFKSSSQLLWSNFRPVSILTCLSKIFEIAMSNQMDPHLETIFSIYLSAYRKLFGCHSVLIHSTETWKKALDNKQYVGVIMSDLSKAFDCLPHNLLLEKIKCYGFSANSVSLINSYLSNRVQRVKQGHAVSSWAPLTKGVPQGSFLGPQFFNLYINDLLLDLVRHNIVPCNYADDNSSSVICDSKEETISRVQDMLSILVNWFDDNLMKANVSKFQFMLLCPDKDENKQTHMVQVNDIILSSQDGAILLGVHIDKTLSFNTHVKLKCKKANSKLLALKRLSSFLTEECRLAILRSFVVSHFIYCSPLFHFTNKYFKTKQEKILYRGLRFVFDDYSSTCEELLSRADMCSLEILREKAIILEMFKCLHGLGPKYMREIFDISNVASRVGKKFVLPRVNSSTYGLKSLRYEGPKLWNALPAQTKSCENISSLKIKLAVYDGESCRCAMCR